MFVIVFTLFNIIVIISSLTHKFLYFIKTTKISFPCNKVWIGNFDHIEVKNIFNQFQSGIKQYFIWRNLKKVLIFSESFLQKNFGYHIFMRKLFFTLYGHAIIKTLIKILLAKNTLSSSMGKRSITNILHEVETWK